MTSRFCTLTAKYFSSAVITSCKFRSVENPALVQFAFKLVCATKLNLHVASGIAASQMQQVAIVGTMTVIEVVVTNLFHCQNVKVVHHLSNE